MDTMNVAQLDTKLLHKISLLMNSLRAVNPTITMQVAHTFILVALNEGRSITEIANLSGFRLPTVSRNLLDLGARNRKREPGLGLVETVVDPMELRRKTVKLSPKGKTLLNQLLDIMQV